MKKFFIRVKNKPYIVRDNLTEVIKICYQMLDASSVDIQDLAIQEESWSVDVFNNPVCGISRTVSFSRIDFEVKDGDVLNDLSRFSRVKSDPFEVLLYNICQN